MQSLSSSQRRSPLRSLLTVLATLALALVSLPALTASPAQAATCGQVLVAGSNWLGGTGVDVRSNGNKQGTGYSCAGEREVQNLGANPSQMGYGWQCVELINRLYMTKGWSGYLSLTGGVAKNMYSDAANGKFRGLSAKVNGSGYQPVPGDVIVHSNGTYGHVAVVNYVSGSTLYAVDQNNGASGQASYTYNASNGAISKPGVTIAGYVHAEKNAGVGGGTASVRYVKTASSPSVYAVAGGATFPVTSWDNVGGPKSVQVVNQEEFNTFGRFPADGTYLKDYGSPSVYVAAGGAALPVPSWESVGGPKPVAELPASSIGNYLLRYPLDGTLVQDYGSPSVYVVAGGAGLFVTGWDAIGGARPVALLPQSTVGSRLRQYPADGTTIVNHRTGSVYVVAGGAGLAVRSFANIPPVTSLTRVDGWAIDNQLRRYPSDGTVLRDQNSGSITVVAGGASFLVSSLGNVPYRSWTHVDWWSVQNQLRSFPAAETYIRNYSTGTVYRSDGTRLIPLSSWSQVGGPKPYTDVDRWSLWNQYGVS